jgi:transcriptional regulator with XRE-family HTH domain
VANYSEAIIGNIRAERARKAVTQADVVTGMRALGFTNWHRQTMARIELGERRLLAEEVLGLAEVLHVPAVKLLSQE